MSNYDKYFARVFASTDCPELNSRLSFLLQTKNLNEETATTKREQFSLL